MMLGNNLVVRTLYDKDVNIKGLGLAKLGELMQEMYKALRNSCARFCRVSYKNECIGMYIAEWHDRNLSREKVKTHDTLPKLLYVQAWVKITMVKQKEYFLKMRFQMTISKATL